MSILNNKIDFAVILSVHRANPNGDPLNGNRPRADYEGYGEISDVCLKRKIRNRFLDLEQPIFVQSDERRVDEFGSLSERANGCQALDGVEDKDMYARIACQQWLDVRGFGQVFAFKNAKKGEGVSIGVRGPISIHPAFSISPVTVESLQITKSVNSEPGEKKSSDTMGMKHRVGFGLYVFYGSINCQLAEKTGFSQEDADLFHQVLKTLFENDASAARPDGSMEVRDVFWWKHSSKTGQYSSAKVHRSLKIVPKTELPKNYGDYEIAIQLLENLEPEHYHVV